MDESDKKSASTKQGGKRSQKRNQDEDYLTEDLKKEVDECSPMEGDRDQETGCLSAAGLLRLKNICEILFEKGRIFRNVYELDQFAKRLASKWYFHVVRQSFSLACHYKPRLTPHKYNQVSPGRQRKVKQSLKALVQCPWEIKFSPIGPRDKEKLASEIPVKITNGNFVHTCKPGIQSQAEAIKKSGAAFDFSTKKAALSQIVDMLESGAVPPSTLRALIRKHVPSNVPISATDLHNFRTRALAYSLTDRSLEADDVSKLLRFQELEEDDFQCFETEVGMKKVKEILRQALQDTGEIWVVECFLRKMKMQVPGFDYRIPRNAEGRPVGVVWMMKEMRRAWLRYGHAIFLDAQKRKMNKLHWAYIGPVVVDNENTIEVVCESLMIEETHESEAFVLNSLFEMEPRRPPTSVKVIFGDCSVTESLLPLIHLDSEETSIFWDHYHLQDHVWKRGLSPSVYASVIHNLLNMINAPTKDAYDQEWEVIKNILGPHQQAVSYLRGFYEKPERIAKYMLDKVHLSIGKRGSSHAEQNHSSHVAYLGSGGAKEIEEHIEGLIRRQGERVSAKRRRDYAYTTRCALRAKDATMFTETEGLALTILSQYCYESHYLVSREESSHYVVSRLDDGSKEIKRRGASEESVRTLLCGPGKTHYQQRGCRASKE
jgi:hypothetical protein